MYPTQSWLNTLSFPGMTSNLLTYYGDFLKTWKGESENLFQRIDMGENGETVYRMEEISMSQYAHDKPEGNDARRLQFSTGYYKEIRAYRIGAQLNISYEMRHAPRFAPKMGKVIARFVSSVSTRMELDRQHQFGFVNATSYINMDGRTVNTATGDGLAVASAVHTLANSTTTWSNIVPTNPSLSVTALEAAEKIAVTQILDPEGLPARMDFTHLIVNRQDPNTVRVAEEILRSTTLVTQANPGVINTFKQKYELVVLSYLATNAMGQYDSTKAKWWFLGAFGPDGIGAYELVWEAPHMNAMPNASVGNNGLDPFNDDYTYGARARYGHGFTSGRGLIVSMAS